MAKKKPVKIVTQPFLKGSPLDSRTLRSVLSLFATYLLITLLYLIVASLMLIEATWIRMFICAAVLLITWAMLFYSGQAKGADAVDYGEKLWSQQEKGREISREDRKRSYHPLKGFVNAYLAILPFFVTALILSSIATLQRTGLAPLPSWLSSYSSMEEVSAPLAFYSISTGFSLESILRIAVRLHLMPWVSLFDSSSAVQMLRLERLSPLLTLISPVFFGIGYTRGVAVRTQVHTAIAANERKRQRKQKRQVKARRAARQPEQLN